MTIGAMGKTYEHGQLIIRQGQAGDCMFVVQKGHVEVFIEQDGHEARLAVLDSGDTFGEMALFTRQVRSASVRSMGRSRVLTIDKKGFLRRVHEDPSLAFQILRKMSQRIEKLDRQLLEARRLLARQTPPANG